MASLYREGRRTGQHLDRKYREEMDLFQFAASLKDRFSPEQMHEGAKDT